MNQTSDVVIIGAGIIGAATAYYATKRGLRVCVVDQGSPAGGTTSRCEGNILVSDKERGPELDLMLHSLGLWRGELAEFGHRWEFEHKGGVVVAARESSLTSLARFSAAQQEHGIRSEPLNAAQLRELEPHVRDDAVGAAFYPDDCQVQPILAATHLLRLARDRGATVLSGARVTGIIRRGASANAHADLGDGTASHLGRVEGVRTSRGNVSAPLVVNATGPWASEIAKLAGSALPVLPRKGYVLVTAPLPPMVHHKVYAAEYVDNVGSGDAALQASPVVEGTASGTILIGSSRERVGLDDRVSTDALRQIARNAIELFPFLGRTKIIRHYHGFRPFCPDHLPVIGEDPNAPGLWHAVGHEGAGIGLAPATGDLLTSMLTGDTPALDPSPFRASRFETQAFESEEPSHVA